jgi:hypothetical protein
MVIIANRLGKKVATFPKNLFKESAMASFQPAPMSFSSPFFSEVHNES